MYSCLWTLNWLQESYILGLSSPQTGSRFADTVPILSAGPVSYYHPFELIPLTFRVCVCHCIYRQCIPVCTKWMHCFSFCFSLWNCLNHSMLHKRFIQLIFLGLIKMWMNWCLLLVCPHLFLCLLSFCPIYAAARFLLLQFPLSVSVRLSHSVQSLCDNKSHKLCHCLEGELVPSWGNLVPSYISGRALIVLSM